MATFTGLEQDFHRYIGPSLRNLIQSVTRLHKKAIGSCMHCGTGGILESAHINGRGRKQIISSILAAASPSTVLTVDLRKFWKSFHLEHSPIEKAFLVLCNSCHKKYDSKSQTPLNSTLGVPISAAVKNYSSKFDILPITFSPSPVAAFKMRLLLQRKAEIFIYYNNQWIERKPWNATKLSATSDIIRNIRSRPILRHANWQRNGIVKVHVSA